MAEKNLDFLSNEEFDLLQPFLTESSAKKFDGRTPPDLNKNSVDTIVLHHTLSSYGAPYGGNYFMSGTVQFLKDNGTGYHFFIKSSGKVIQGVELGKQAYHAGKSYGPSGYELNN